MRRATPRPVERVCDALPQGAQPAVGATREAVPDAALQVDTQRRVLVGVKRAAPMDFTGLADDVDAEGAPELNELRPMLGVDRLSGLTGGDVTLCVPRGDERISNVEELGSLPRSVIGFLTLLGVAGVAYLLSASFRRTRRDLAVLRVLGFTRRQVAATVLVQAGAVGSVGALVALPFGIAFGRAAWRGVAGNVGVVVMPEVSVLGTLGVVLAAVVVAELLALPFAATAATRQSVQMLRAE